MKRIVMWMRRNEVGEVKKFNYLESVLQVDIDGGFEKNI